MSPRGQRARRNSSSPGEAISVACRHSPSARSNTCTAPAPGAPTNNRAPAVASATPKRSRTTAPGAYSAWASVQSPGRKTRTLPGSRSEAGSPTKTPSSTMTTELPNPCPASAAGPVIDARTATAAMAAANERIFMTVTMIKVLRFPAIPRTR